MARVKMTPFTYKGMKVKLLVDITNWPPFDDEILAPAGTIVEVQKTLHGYHHVKVEDSFKTWPVKIENTEIAY